MDIKHLKTVQFKFLFQKKTKLFILNVFYENSAKRKRITSKHTVYYFLVNMVY
jgi:hypothetical protein